MARTKPKRDENTALWRERAVARSLSRARSRAEERVQRFLDAAFSLVDEKGTTEFTIQEVVERSKQSLRAFYQYFDGKDELLLALFEESVRASVVDIESELEGVEEPLERLRTFTVRLHEWCEPREAPPTRGAHDRVPISEFALQLALKHPDRVGSVFTPLTRILFTLLEEAAAAGVIAETDTRAAAALVQQTVMYGWLQGRLVADVRMQASAEATWQFCLHGLRG